MEKHFIQEGIIRFEIENYLKHELDRIGYSGINIQKTPLATRIILYVEKPPLVIGKKGRRINKLTSMLKEKYNIDNPTIDVQGIEKPTLDPNIVARRIAVALERGMNRRRVAYKALRAVMSSKAMGVEIILSGKIVGKGNRARAEKYQQGYMRKAGDSTKLVRVGSTQASLKSGVIGVTVKIIPPGTVFPDYITLKPKVSEEIVEETAEISQEAPKEKVPKSEEKTEGKPAKEEKPKKSKKPEKKETTKPKKPAEKTSKKTGDSDDKKDGKD